MDLCSIAIFQFVSVGGQIILMVKGSRLGIGGLGNHTPLFLVNSNQTLFFFFKERRKKDTVVATLTDTVCCGSALGLVGQVSVQCDWVRYPILSATSVSVWQHTDVVKAELSPRYNVACCRDSNQQFRTRMVYLKHVI